MSERLRQSGSASPGEFARLSLRYRGATARVRLALPAKNFFGRKRAVEIEGELLDVSVGGVLVEVPDGPSIQEGLRVGLTFEGEHTAVGLRHIEPGADGRSRCGLAFRDPSPAFEAVVNETIESLITDPKRNDAWRMNG